jgi:hypothetical protein
MFRDKSHGKGSEKNIATGNGNAVNIKFRK